MKTLRLKNEKIKRNKKYKYAEGGEAGGVIRN